MIRREHIIRGTLGLAAVSLFMGITGCAAGTDSGKEQSNIITYGTDETDETESVDESDAQSEEDGEKEQVNRDGQVKETMMVYLVGSNLESVYGAGTADLQEMALSGYDQDEMNIVICAGGSSYWWNDAVSADRLSVYELKDQDLNATYEMTNENMGQAATLTEFIDYSYQEYPAEHYSLIFWDHGGGAVIGYGVDENYNNDMLSVSELQQGMQDSVLGNGAEKLDLIGFDACLMGMVEVADVFSPYAEYLIASEEVEAGDGWDYSCLGEISGSDAYEGSAMAKHFITSFSDYYDQYGYYSPDYTLSCVDLNQIDQVVEGLENLAAKATESLNQGNYHKIAKMRDRSKTFGRISSEGFYDYVDLYSLAMYMESEFPEESRKLQKAIESAVVSNESNMMDAVGLSVYFPYENKDYVQEWMAAYEQNGFSPVYTEFIKTFSNTLSGNTLYEWEVSEVSPSQGDSASEYYVQLTQEQIDSYAHAQSSIWQQEEGDTNTYICWMNSKDVTLSQDGKLSSEYDGRIFYLENANGESLPCCAVEVERTEEYVKYAIPVTINVLTDEMKSAYIHVKVDEANPEGYIAGVYSTLDTESELYPDKNIIVIEDGDIISPFYFARDIVFLDDQTVAPFEQWENSSGIGSDFVVDGELGVSLKENREQGDYAFLFQVTDTQGNSYFTNYLSVAEDAF